MAKLTRPDLYDPVPPPTASLWLSDLSDRQTLIDSGLRMMHEARLGRRWQSFAIQVASELDECQRERAELREELAAALADRDRADRDAADRARQCETLRHKLADSDESVTRNIAECGALRRDLDEARRVEAALRADLSGTVLSLEVAQCAAQQETAATKVAEARAVQAERKLAAALTALDALARLYGGALADLDRARGAR